jgi:hypothetical protein
VLPLGGWTGVGVWCLALSPLDGGHARVERAAAAEPAPGDASRRAPERPRRHAGWRSPVSSSLTRHSRRASSGS